MEPISSDLLHEYNQTRTQGHEAFCHAPFRSMYFPRTGNVSACCWNKGHLLGKYPQQSIKEIWESASTQALRDKLTRNDLSGGCHICYVYLLGRNFSNIKSKYFDHLSTPVDHSYPLRMDFELSNVCNVECTTCFGDLSSSIRRNREGLPPFPEIYGDQFIEQLAEFIPYLKVATFMGGEPFLINIYYRIWELFAKLNPTAVLDITVNATVLNNKVKDILERCTFEITVSRDCMDHDKLESLRKNTNSRSQLKNIEYFNEYCQKNGRIMMLNTVFSTLNWMDLPEVALYGNSLGAKLYVCTVLFPYKHSVRGMSVPELTEMERFYVQQVDLLPDGNAVELHNKKALEGVLNYIRSRIKTLSVAHPNGNAEVPKDVVTYDAFMKKIHDFSLHAGADIDSTLAKFEKAMEVIRQRNPNQYQQLLQASVNDDFDLALSQVIWREQDHLQDYLPEYIVAG